VIPLVSVTKDSAISQKLYAAVTLSYEETIREIFSIDYEGSRQMYYICGAKDNQDRNFQLKEIIKCNYLNVENPAEPLVKREIKLCLETSKPFRCAPRRLDYSEKEKLQKLLDEYLKEGIRICFNSFSPNKKENTTMHRLLETKEGVN